MAHFEKIDSYTKKSYQITSNEEIPVRVGKEVKIFLWGGDFDGSPLLVTSSNPNILKVEEDFNGIKKTNYRTFKVTALSDSITEKIFAHSKNAPNGSPWDEITFLILDKSERPGPYYRERVIQLALSFTGCHYLWGAAGAYPDMGGGMPSRSGSVFY